MGVSKKNKLILFSAIYTYIRKEKVRQRRYQVHPLNLDRKIHGEYFRLVEKLKKYPEKFYAYFRMEEEQFNYILELVKGEIEPKFVKFRKDTIGAKEKLAITLRFLATGASFTDLGFRFMMGISTIKLCIEQVLRAIIKLLKNKVMPMPKSSNFWNNIRNDFLGRWNFPNCLGAVDGKHIKMFAPFKSGSLYFNYKKSFSIVLMAVADAKYKFISVSVGALGSNSDSSVFNDSNFGKLWFNHPDELKIPSDTEFPGTIEPKPHFLIGDEAFGLKYNLMTPFPGTSLSLMERIYNYRLARARRLVESSFGILCHTFRILLKSMEVQPKLAKIIVLGCCILHNFLKMDIDEVKQVVIEDSTNENEPQFDHTKRMQDSASKACDIRRKLAEWCIQEGNVSFQYQMI